MDIERLRDELRTSGNHTDDEILDLVESCKADLILSGVHKDKCKENDPLIRRAIIVYCKANFGYEDDSKADRFQRSYDNLKQHLTLSQEYISAGVDNEP